MARSIDFANYRGQWVAFDYSTDEVFASAATHAELLGIIRGRGIEGAVITHIPAEDEVLAIGFA